MATVKFPSEMAPATSIGGNDKLMISKEATGEAYQATFNQAKEYLNITGIELEPLVGGDTSGTALVVAPGPSGEQRTAEVASGKYYDFGSGPQLADADKRWKAYWSGSSWSLKDMGALPTPDTSQLVAKSELKSNSLIQPTSTYIKQNTAIASNGNTVVGGSANTAVSIVDFPLQANKTYTFGGFLASNAKTWALVNASGVVGSYGNLATLPKTITTDSTYIYLRVYLKQPDGTETGDNWSATLMLNEGSTLLTKSVNKIGTSEIEAKGLANGNTVPDPVTDKNAVNKSYLESNTVLKNGLGLERSLNIADPSSIISGKYIDNAGGIGTVAGWKMIAIDVTGIPDGANITFGRFTIHEGGHSAFYNGNTLVLYNGQFTNGLLPRTVVKPAGATILYVDISRPTGTNEFSQVTVNVGNTLIDYKPYATVVSIDGKPLSGSGGSGTGGNPFNQNLNKEDTVQFAKVQAGQIDTSVLVLNLPTSPSGLITGRAWIDTANGNVIKVVS